MSEPIDVGELDLSNAELVQVLKNHNISRRTLMKLFGSGAAVAAFSGTAAAESEPPDKTDKVYGASYAKDVHKVPKGRVDHAVELHVHPGDGMHEGFPGPDDSRDANRRMPGFQPDPDDRDDMPEFFFDPVGLHVKPDEVVQFTNHGHGLHTVTSFHPKFNEPPFLVLPERVPTDHAFTSSLVSGGDSWLYKFTKKGVYDLLCLPHVPLGMVMRVVVFDPEEDDIESSMFDEPAPDPKAPLMPSARMVLSDGKLDPGTIVDQGSIKWEDLSLGGGPNQLPRPSVTELSMTEEPTSDPDAEFNVSWTVSGAGLTTVELRLTDVTDGELEDVKLMNVENDNSTTANGWTRLVASLEDGHEHTYQVELTVTDDAGMSVTRTATATEDGIDD